MKLEELYETADKNNIDIYYYPLCHMVSISMPNAVAIDVDNIDTTAEEKECLAHELGHCMTGSFYTIGTMNTRGRMDARANGWAIKKLLPFSELNEAVISGIYETWDLAEYFELPESFIKTAVHYYVNCRGLKFNDKIAQI